MNTMEQIRKRYGVPAKRGMVAFKGDFEGTITGTPRSGGHYVNVRDWDGYRYTFHPLDLNYRTEGGIIYGDKLKTAYDDRVDRFNAQLATPELDTSDVSK